MSMFSRHTGTQSCTWTADLTNGPSTGRRTTSLSITLRHNTLSGSRQLLCDGAPVPGTRGRSSLLSKSDVWAKVQRPDGGGEVQVIVVITPDLTTTKLFSYKCSIDGAEVPAAQSSAFAKGGGAALPAQPVLQLALQFCTEYRIDRDPTGNRIVRYRIAGSLLSPAAGSVSKQGPEQWFRFSEMSNIANIVRSSYKSTHLSSSFPSFPSRCLDPRVDQYSVEFLRERAANLESFWRVLCGIPRIERSADLLRFLALPVNEGLSV
ncbi:hypothetical protein TeGR_g8425 [Tetraparma gracilis]|uniref:PX domain-containing protein n=1 Tax=Tetraparma gracilis TaxID=2962635 RepID=A0ABQ6MMM8_9STRA|nr:hypothetical protein TeGR_g8425 [Tetraparma gracilis]